MNKSLIILAFLLALVSFSAHAETYVGAQYTTFKMKSAGYSAEPSIGVLRMGKKITRDSAFEFRYGGHVAEDTIDVSGVDIEVSIRKMQGIYYLQHFELASALSLYGVLGYTEGEEMWKSTVTYGKTYTDFHDFSYGVGMDLHMGDSVDLNLEVMKYVYEPTIEMYGLSAGLTVKF